MSKGRGGVARLASPLPSRTQVIGGTRPNQMGRPTRVANVKIKMGAPGKLSARGNPSRAETNSDQGKVVGSELAQRTMGN